jgi:hypothetical protein
MWTAAAGPSADDRAARRPAGGGRYRRDRLHAPDHGCELHAGHLARYPRSDDVDTEHVSGLDRCPVYVRARYCVTHADTDRNFDFEPDSDPDPDTDRNFDLEPDGDPDPDPHGDPDPHPDGDREPHPDPRRDRDRDPNALRRGNCLVRPRDTPF